jgi:hypothetical protein
MVMGWLKVRFALLAVAFAVASAVIQYYVMQHLNDQSFVSMDGVQTSPTNNYALVSAVSSFSSLCLVAAGALIVGIVALYVVDYVVDRGLLGGSRDVGPDDVSGELSAYGSDPELL